MTEQECFEKNLELSTEFSKYVLAHPELEAQIPDGAQVVFLVESNPELSRKNRELARQQKEEGQSVVFVHVKGLRPEASRLIEPRLELAAGL
jgi:hypothetical protein